jgi:hypothetical protein
VKTSRQHMTHQTILENAAFIETETICTSCKHFIESEGMFYCKFYEAFFASETLYIPCDFQELEETML